MKIKKTIKFTQKHINEGLPENCTKCAVALAVIEQFPNYVATVTVNSNDPDIKDFGIELHNLDEYLKTKFSKSKTVNNFICLFDSPDASYGKMYLYIMFGNIINTAIICNASA